jgi:hypothetical protein
MWSVAMTRPATRTKLMVADASGRWTAGSSRHTLDQSRGVLQPGELVYRIEWSERWSGRNSGRPRIYLVYGPCSAPKPAMTRRQAWRTFGIPRPIRRTPPAERRRRRNERRRQRLAQRISMEAA